MDGSVINCEREILMGMSWDMCIDILGYSDLTPESNLEIYIDFVRHLHLFR